MFVWVITVEARGATLSRYIRTICMKYEYANGDYISGQVGICIRRLTVACVSQVIYSYLQKNEFCIGEI